MRCQQRCFPLLIAPAHFEARDEITLIGIFAQKWEVVWPVKTAAESTEKGLFWSEIEILKVNIFSPNHM